MSSQHRFFLILFYIVTFALSIGLFALGKIIGSDYLPLAKAFQTLSIIFITLTILSFFKRIVWNGYTSLNGKKPPKLLMDVLSVFIVAIGIVIISVGVFEKSAFSFITAGGLLTTAIIWSLQDFIKDIFSGAVLDLESPYKVGDWLRLEDKIDGQVLNINWRTTTIHTIGQELINIPNSYFTKERYANLSRPDRWYWESFTLDLDHEVPMERACRLMCAAALKAPLIHENICQVYVSDVRAGHAEYVVRFGILDHVTTHEAKHQIIVNIMDELKKHNLKTSQYLGEYSINRRRQGVVSVPEVPEKKSIIQSIDLFEKLTETDRLRIVGHSIDHTMQQDDFVVRQGEEGSSMYIIGEGVAEIMVHEKDSQVDTHVGFLKRGDYFGERALFMGEPRNASVKAKTNLLIYEVPRDVFMPIIQETPSALDHLSYVIGMRDLSRRKTLDEVEKDKIQQSKSILKTIHAFFDTSHK
jgi:small-conductance mechanosensitive channel/CRP-like cAMP-binding protein